MFEPKYHVSPLLLEIIKKIYVQIEILNKHSFSDVVLMDLQQEAREISVYASTSIEGNPLPLTEVKRILKQHPQNARDSEKEVLNYNNTLKWVNDIKAELDEDLILGIHRRITDKLLPKYQSGKFRQDSVVVNDPFKKAPVYYPPDYEDVKRLLLDLLGYIQQNQAIIDPVLLAGIFHKQFVVIHPFMDGNGRTARLATMVLLSRMGLNLFRLFSFENYYNVNITRYFKEVGVKGDFYEIEESIDFTAWLEYFAGGILDELLRVSKLISSKKITPNGILKSHHQLLLEYIQRHGYITDKIYSAFTGRAKATRNKDFNKLIKLNLIQREGKGKNTIYKIVQCLN